MPKTKISDFSTTAGNNTDIDGINIAEGMAPSNVNNAIRELMSQLKDWQSGSVSQDMNVNGAFTATGNAVLSADLTVGDDLIVTGDASVGGAFTCTGTAVLSSNLSVAGTLSATGATSLGAVTCSGAAVLSSTLSVTGNATIGSSTTNSHTLNGNLTVGTSTSNTVTLNTLLSAGGGTGTSGQFLKSNGTASSPSWVTVNSIYRGTVQNSTSGTFVDFLLSSIVSDTSTIKRITVMFSGVSTSGTSNILVQIGDSGGIETSNYLSYANQFNSSPGGSSSTAGFLIFETWAASTLGYGIVTITNVSGNTWVYGCCMGASDSSISVGGGNKTLSDVLDRVRITTVNGTDTFDAGSINILCE
jgi:hypothetical protein